MKVKFKKIRENAIIPTRADEFAGGWDVTASEIEKVSADFYICKLGFALELPKGYKLTLVPRSSITKTHWIIQNSPGLGDENYRGEYQLRFRGIPITTTPTLDSGYSHALSYEKFPFSVGDRVGQIYLEEVIPIEFEEVAELSETDRGDGGFGSTNK